MLTGALAPAPCSLLISTVLLTGQHFLQLMVLQAPSNWMEKIWEFSFLQNDLSPHTRWVLRGQQRMTWLPLKIGLLPQVLSMNYLTAHRRQKHFFQVPRLISLSFLKSNWTVTHGPPVAEAWTIRAQGLTVVGVQEDGSVASVPWASWACRPAPVALGSVLPGPEGRSGNRQLGKWDKKLSLSVFFLENFQVSHTARSHHGRSHPWQRSCGEDLTGKGRTGLEGFPGPARASTPKLKSVCLLFITLCLSPTLLTFTGGYPRPPFSEENQVRALVNKPPGLERSIFTLTPLLLF